MEKEILLISLEGRAILKKWRGESIGTKDGQIQKEDVHKGGMVKTGKGIPYLVTEPRLRDRTQLSERGARPVYEYDAGFIAALMSVQNGDTVIEAGTGSGRMTMILSNAVGPAGRVITYEKEERFYEMAKKSLEGFRNINAVFGDVREARLPESDAAFLDMQHPTTAMECVVKALKPGRFLAVFTPTSDDVKPVMEKMQELGMVGIEAVQFNNLEWELKKYLRVKGLFSFPAFVIVGRRFT